MFNLFKKKEVKKEANPGELFARLRLSYMGNVALNEWPKEDLKEQPWSMFVNARNKLVRQNIPEAEKIYRQIIETAGLESRHYMQAWFFLRYFGKVQPSADVAKKVYGVMVEVCTATGIVSVVAFTDHSARILHSSGGGTVWERPDNSLDEKIDDLIKAGEQAITFIPLVVVDIVPNPPKQVDHVLVCIATPSGIYHGLGTGEFMSKDQYAGPILGAGTNLLQALETKKKQ
jgi:hypothetical protein